MQRLTLIVVLLLAALAAGCNLNEPTAQGAAAAEIVEQISTPPPDATCEELVTLAVSSVGIVCNEVGRNQACYGNTLVEVDFRPDFSVVFQESGDVVDLASVQRISTSPFDEVNRIWGIAFLKAQVNLPDALPGQNVTFLLFGDTEVDNPSPEMQAVTVKTHITGTECVDAPPSAVLVQSPSEQPVTLQINGADVTLGSTAFITAEGNREMVFAILEGSGVIEADGVQQLVVPGAQVRVPLGGEEGYEAVGAPSDPEPFELDIIQHAPIVLLDRRITLPDPIPEGSTPIPRETATPTTPPTAEATQCVPRQDWTARYVIQLGDNLSLIAQRLNIPTIDLQRGNCIDNPNRLIAGQSIRVPRALPTFTPVIPTATPSPTLSADIIGPNLRADVNPVYQGSCTFIRWDVSNIREVYFEGQPTVGSGAQQVCPRTTTTYTLLVIKQDGTQVPFTITLMVDTSTSAPVCGNDICESDLGENANTCSADCGYIIN